MKRIATILFIIFSVIACSSDGGDTMTPGEEDGDVTAGNKKSTGTSSNDLLSDVTYKSLVVEVLYVNGYEPTQTTLNNLTTFLGQRLKKPSGITIQTKSVASPGNSPYTTQEITSIEDTHRTQYNTTDKIAVWVFFADGESANNSGSSIVLGTAYRNTSFVIYENTIHGLSDSSLEPNRSVLETTVINHEFGHLLGLTNLGAPMQTNHEDVDHVKHCNVESCLMFWSAETGDGIANLISGGSAPQLDAQCIADLQANGGK